MTQFSKVEYISLQNEFPSKIILKSNIKSTSQQTIIIINTNQISIPTTNLHKRFLYQRINISYTKYKIILYIHIKSNSSNNFSF